MTDNNDEMNNF